MDVCDNSGSCAEAGKLTVQLSAAGGGRGQQ